MTPRSDVTKSHAQAEAQYITPENDAEIDVAEILGVLRKRIGVIAGCVFLITSIVVLVTFQLTPHYTANAKILIDPLERNVTDLESVVSGLSPESSTVESQVEVIRSQSLATMVIESLQLDRDPEFNTALREPGAVGAAVDWMTGLIPGQVEVISEQERLDREKTRTVEAFSNALDVSRLGRLSFVISISFTSEDAAKAARITNALADLYLVAQLEAKFDAARRASEWLDERLSPLRQQLLQSENAAEVYRAEQNLIGDSRGATLNEQQLLEVNRQLLLARAELAEKRARFQRMNQLLPSQRGIESVAAVLQSVVVADLRQQQAELARKQGELASRYGARHPRMINVLAEQKDLQQQFDAEVNRIVANLENEVEVARSRDRSLTRDLEQLQREASVHEQARIRLRELEREAAADRTVYESFLGRFKETREQQGIQQADARIISSAATPVDPSFPNKPLNAAVGFMMSVFIGLGAAFLLEKLDDGLSTDRQLELELQLPHLVSIPDLEKIDDAADDYSLVKPLSSYGEALRSLRAKLLFSDVPPKLLMFTSSLPSEGKTTTTINMGRSAAEAGMRVLVIDADLRHPNVAKTLGLEPKAGLVEYLEGETPLEDVLLLDEPSGMQVIPVASGTPNPPDLLASPAMRDMLEKLKIDFDLILVDTPPVLALADAKVVGRFVDKVVFVVQWQKTPRKAAQDAVRDLRAFGVDIAGAVFNRLDPELCSKYGYAGYYYRGGYSHYNTNRSSNGQRANTKS